MIRTPPAIHGPASAQSLTWLRVARELRGMTQDDLADASGVSKVAISRLENAHRHPRWETARALGSALDVEPHRLFPDEGKPSPADVLAEYLGLSD
jgi:transcriptional regulator with XRE-family HTH domain